LGEAIVSGQITPDSYVVHKVTRFILDKNVVTQERGLFRVDSRTNKEHSDVLKNIRIKGKGEKRSGNEWVDIPTAEGEKQVLSDEEILELSDIIIGIEKHYGFPCDIEWAREKGKFYIVQSRPITTLK
jgi:pyruvate,water dikinase